jgi:glycerol-3-phosphate dehydrogenase
MGGIMKTGIIWLGKTIHRTKDTSTAIISRNHVIEKSSSGLVSLMGGKWTTFRSMGEETVNEILKDNPKSFEPKNEKSMTRKFRMIGSYTKVETQHGLAQE